MVQPDEVGEAMRRGVELVHPHDRPIPGQMAYDNNYGPASYQVRLLLSNLYKSCFYLITVVLIINYNTQHTIISSFLV